jgi:holliday junction DNA helicase RuvA
LISSLRGTLIKKSPEGIVVETGGVGLDVLVPLTVLYELPDPGNVVQLLVHTHMRESQFLLIGFLRQDEKETFRLLMTVNGIGPKLAVNILSGLPAEELLETVHREDAPRLQRIPGVGKKMAERIVLELKDKMPAREISLGNRGLRGQQQAQYFSELLSALMNLGYKRKEAEQAVEETLSDPARVEQENLESLLRVALRALMRDLG